jgi:hypothetical protein
MSGAEKTKEQDVKEKLEDASFILLKGALKEHEITLTAAQNAALLVLWKRIDARRKLLKTKYDETAPLGHMTEIYKQFLVMVLNEQADIMDDINEIMCFADGGEVIV